MNEKASIRLDATVLAEARSLAGARGLSSLVEDALRRRLERIRVSTLLDETDTEYGPVPEDVEQEVDAEWSAARDRPGASSSPRAR